MAKLHLDGGITFEGTPEEIKAYTDLYAEKADSKLGPVPEAPKFKVGDYIVGNDASRYGITNDKMTLGKVVKEYTDGYDDIRVEVLRHATESEKVGVTFGVQSKYFRKATAEEIADYEESLKPSFKEGDIVVITGNTSYSANEVGDIGIIAKLGERRFNVNVEGRKQGDGYTWTEPTDVRHATQAERQAYEESLKPASPKLKAGDWVTINTDRYDEDITDGKAYEVLKDDDGDLYFLDNAGDRRWNPLNYTDNYEIVAPPTAFERAGRKEGEFKVGDVVRITEYDGVVLSIDDIGVVSEVIVSNNQYRVNVPHKDVVGNSRLSEHMELIAPVESRVDVPCT